MKLDLENIREMSRSHLLDGRGTKTKAGRLQNDGCSDVAPDFGDTVIGYPKTC